ACILVRWASKRSASRSFRSIGHIPWFCSVIAVKSETQPTCREACSRGMHTGSPVTIQDWMFSTRRVLMQAGSKIAVAGATGRVGRHVVAVLKAQGHEVVSMSRSNGVDVVTGDGLAQALSGVECIIDVATTPESDQAAATEFFTAAAHNLQVAGERAGVQRIVVVS